ncbi:MAG: hypothetical protein LBE35_07915 [Clostridiales bacterium]|jgi:flagellin|nr:hypothetical protein [Clostridiales bacterium]
MANNMIIRTNVLALNSHRNLGLVGNIQANASARLSSGLRINSAADDAAGLAISEGMRAQIRGMNQAARNALDGISLVQTAEGYLQTIHEMLHRARELVVQAANDTNSIDDRMLLQGEINHVLEEIDRITTQATFNTLNILDGSLDRPNLTIANVRGILDDIAEDPAANVSGNFSDSQANLLRNWLNSDAGRDFILNDGDADGLFGAGGALEGLLMSYNTHELELEGGYAVMEYLHGVWGGTLTESQQLFQNLLNDYILYGGNTYFGAIASDSQLHPTLGLAGYWAGFADTRPPDFGDLWGRLGAHGWFESSGPSYNAREMLNTWARTQAFPGDYVQVIGRDGVTVIADEDGDGFFDNFWDWGRLNSVNIPATITTPRGNSWTGIISHGFEDATDGEAFLGGLADTLVSTRFGEITIRELFERDGSLNLQIGPNSPDRMYVRISAMNLAELGLTDLLTDDLTLGNGVVQDDSAAISAFLPDIDAAIGIVSDQRAALGAMQNRLEFTIENLNIAAENLSASESRIRDADMAREIMRLAQADVLQQTALAILAQANHAPQSALELLA